jgi:ABC-type sugar transport system ATPase subunit
MAIIVIAHNYAQIFDVCDRVNLIEGGRVVFDKPTAATSVGELTDIVVNRYRRARAGLRDTPAAPDEK